MIYKSPHKTDLSFAKGETIRVTGPSPDDDDWLVGETLDGSRSGGFPKDFVQPVESVESVEAAEPKAESVEETPSNDAPSAAPEVPESAPVVSEPVAVQELEPTPAKAAPPPQAPAASPPATTTKPPTADDGEEKRPQSMKERLAFFAAAQDKPAPPPIKPKPAAGGLTWSQRQKLRQEQEAKEREEAAARGESAPAPVSAAPAPTLPEPVEQAPKEQQEGAGMSTADAVSSITKGGSLKDRMAALQGSGAFGQQQEKPPPPAPSGKVWSRPAAPPQPDTEVAKGEEGASREGDGTVPEGTEATHDDEESEEAKEKARKAAITARLAKLGARGPMGVMPTAPPVRKQSTKSVTSPSVEKAEPVAPESSSNDDGAPVATPLAAAVPKEAPESETESAAPPKSIPIAAVPRRTAPPRRRTAPRTTSSNPAPESETPPMPERDVRLETKDAEGHPVPPQQVMVANEEAPLPKTEEQLETQRQQEQRGESIGGLEGAQAAGIAVDTPGDGAEQPEQVELEEDREIVESLGEKPEPAVAFIGADDTEKEKATAGPDPIESIPAQKQVVEGDEKDVVPQERPQSILKTDDLDRDSADKDRSGPLSPSPITTVPLRPAGPDSPVSPVNAEEPPLPRARRMTIEDMPLDEVERKHMHEQTHETPVQWAPLARDPSPSKTVEVDAAPPPPPRRSLDKPAGPRPLPSAPTAIVSEEAPAVPARNPDRALSQVDAPEHHARALPPPPPEAVPPQDEEEEGQAVGLGDEEVEAVPDEEEDEESNTSPPPPPVRKETLPSPVQVGVPTPARAPPVPVSPVKPKMVDSPTRSRTLETSPVTAPAEKSPEDAEELNRRSSIAARMAKLGGVKFGMPPPQQFKKQSSGATSAREVEETGEVASVDRQGSVPDNAGAAPVERSATEEEEEETPEQEAARRRATLARLRAGGALGFGMFNQGAPGADSIEADKEHVDERNLEDDSMAEETRDEAPPLPPSRAPAVPPPAPPIETEDDEEDDAPPPLPASRPSMSESRPTAPAADPESPTLSSRPPIPAATQRRSLPPQPRDADAGETAPPPPPRQLPQEPEVQETEEEDEAPPPPPPMRIGHAAGVYGEPRTSTSGSRPSGASLDQPLAAPPPPAEERTAPSPQASVPAATQPRASGEQQGRRSTTLGTRPGYDQLREASANVGAGLVRSAHAIFQQGKRGQYGDGSSTGFVLLAMQNVGITPAEGWGQVIFEQEGGSILRRYDEPRPGDIAAFYDAKLRGKKGLSTYSQHVGSVEEPLVGVVAEFEERKHKLRVLQVERGVPEEVSYRSEDLKSGRILVHRPGI
ncbi:hypothetical protein I350_02267 [Cryptococcus amylolentus CBS 6273]|uniref:SH3 domain-containing protein n=1 Tax=Cryptococcus amylolentus CBS 6273 TaxID=1296118 RepID=A0A1E3KCM6_9TREE|nr:hypothetical protein I350_02267 [Cryptococcus amylolentus CBS 6273]